MQDSVKYNAHAKINSILEVSLIDKTDAIIYMNTHGAYKYLSIVIS